MAKKTDDFDEFSLEDNDSDTGASTNPAAKAAGLGGIAGILGKLPIAGVLGKVKGGIGAIKPGRGGTKRPSDNPTLPIIALGAGVLVLVLVLIIMVVMLVGSLAKAGEQGNRKQKSSDTESVSPVPGTISRAPASGLSPDQEAPLVSTSSANAAREPLKDPYFQTAILPDEPALMTQGEIRYGREPQANWSADDARPGWQELGQLYKKLLREQNTRDFYRLLGAEEPKSDLY